MPSRWDNPPSRGTTLRPGKEHLTRNRKAVTDHSLPDTSHRCAIGGHGRLSHLATFDGLDLSW